MNLFYPAYLVSRLQQSSSRNVQHPGTGRITAKMSFGMTSGLASSSEGWSRNRVLWLCGQKIDGMNTISRVLDDWNLVFHGCWNCGREHEVVDVPACWKLKVVYIVHENRLFLRIIIHQHKHQTTTTSHPQSSTPNTNTNNYLHLLPSKQL